MKARSVRRINSAASEADHRLQLLGELLEGRQPLRNASITFINVDETHRQGGQPGSVRRRGMK